MGISVSLSASHPTSAELRLSQVRLVGQNTHLNTADLVLHTVGPVKFGWSAILPDQGRIGKR